VFTLPMKLMTSQAENPMEKTEFCRPDDGCERLSKPVERNKCVAADANDDIRRKY
jgi:hypothetical protein